MTVLDTLQVVIEVDGRRYLAQMRDIESTQMKFAATTKKTTDDASRHFEKFGRALRASNIPGGFNMVQMGLAGVTLGLAGMGVAALRASMNYDQALTNSMSVTGLFGQEAAKAKKEADALAQQLGRETSFSAKEAADAMYDLASKGYQVTTWAQTLPPILRLAEATQSDLASTTELVTSTINQFNLSQADAARVADVYAYSIGRSAATQAKLAESMRYVGPVASAVNWSLEQTVATLSRLYDAGFLGEQAGTALRMSLIRLQAPPKEAADALKKLGITSVDVAEGGLLQVIEKMNTAGATAGDFSKVFGVEAAAAMLKLRDYVQPTAKSVQNLTKDMENAGGTAERISKEQLNTAAGQWKILRSSVEGVAIAIGKFALPGFQSLTHALQSPVNKLTEFLDKLRESKEWQQGDLSVRVGLLVGAAGDVAAALGKATLEFLGKMDWALIGNAIATATAKAMMDLGPIIVKVALQMAWEGGKGLATGTTAGLTGAPTGSDFEKMRDYLAERMAGVYKDLPKTEAFRKALEDLQNYWYTTLLGGAHGGLRSMFVPVAKTKEEVIALAQAFGLTFTDGEITQIQETNQQQFQRLLSGPKFIGPLWTPGGDPGAGLKGLTSAAGGASNALGDFNTATLDSATALAKAQEEAEHYAGAVETLTGITKDILDPQGAWNELVKATTENQEKNKQTIDGSKTSLKDYLKVLQEQLANQATFESNLKTLAICRAVW